MNITFIGYSGKMGSVIYDELSPTYNFVHLVDRQNEFKEEILLNTSLILDFSTPSTLMNIANYALRKSIPIISGTTGLTKRQIETLETLVNDNDTSMYLVSNFDITLNYVLDMLKCVDGKYSQCLITDTHHISKSDKPSGTSLTLATHLPNTRVKFKSVRSGKYKYRHHIKFHNSNSSVTIIHEVYSKKAYVDGVIIALETIFKFKGIRYAII